MGSMSDGRLSPLLSLMRRTASGSPTPAVSSAPTRSMCSGCSTDLTATVVAHDASAKTMINATPTASASMTALSRYRAALRVDRRALQGISKADNAKRDGGDGDSRDDD